MICGTWLFFRLTEDSESRSCFSTDFDQDCSSFINLHQKKNDCFLGSNASSHEPIVPFCC